MSLLGLCWQQGSIRMSRVSIVRSRPHWSRTPQISEQGSISQQWPILQSTVESRKASRMVRQQQWYRSPKNNFERCWRHSGGGELRRKPRQMATSLLVAIYAGRGSQENVGLQSQRPGYVAWTLWFIDGLILDKSFNGFVFPFNLLHKSRETNITNSHVSTHHLASKTINS